MGDAGRGAIAGISAGSGAGLTDGPGGGGLGSGLPSPSAAAPAAAALRPAAPKLARAVGRTVDARKVYFVFMALAGVGLASGWLVRTLGVRF